MVALVLIALRSWVWFKISIYTLIGIFVMSVLACVFLKYFVDAQGV